MLTTEALWKYIHDLLNVNTYILPLANTQAFFIVLFGKPKTQDYVHICVGQTLD